MRLLNNIRLALLVIVVLPCLAMAGVFAAVQWWRGSGTLHVVPSPGSTVSVSIDGGPAEPLYAGNHLRRELPQGSHHVVISSEEGITSMEVNVNSGFWSELVPASPRQCWAKLEVSNYYFGTHRELPTVTARHPSTATVPLDGAYLSEAELPRSIEEGRSVGLLLPMNCAMMALPDATLVSALGYQL